MDKYKFKNRFIENEAKRLQVSVDWLASYWLSFLDRDYIWILPNELVLIAADSWVWKTQLSVDLAVRNIQEWKKVMFFALEWWDEDIHHRIVTTILRAKPWFNFATYRYNLDKTITTNTMQAIYNDLWDLWENLYVYYYEDSLPWMNEILQIMDQMKDQVDMFIVDHLHYINHWEERDEYKAISQAMESFKKVTKILRKPIVLISHTRWHSNWVREEPTEYDLHGSSNIIKQADSCILISTVKEPEKFQNLDVERYPPDRYSFTRINVAKSRVLWYKRRYITVYDMFEKRYIEAETVKQERKTQTLFWKS